MITDADAQIIRTIFREETEPLRQELARTNAALELYGIRSGILEKFAERVVAQSELLTKRAERERSEE